MGVFHPPVPAGEDVAVPERSTAPPLESLPSKVPDGAPPAPFPPEATVSPEATVTSGAGGENPGVVEGDLSSIYQEMEALGLTQGEGDPLPAGLNLGDLTPAPLSPCSLPLTIVSAPVSEKPLDSSTNPATDGTLLMAAEPVEVTASATRPGLKPPEAPLVGMEQSTSFPANDQAWMSKYDFTNYNKFSEFTNNLPQECRPQFQAILDAGKLVARYPSKCLWMQLTGITFCSHLCGYEMGSWLQSSGFPKEVQVTADDLPFEHIPAPRGFLQLSFAGNGELRPLGAAGGFACGRMIPLSSQTLMMNLHHGQTQEYVIKPKYYPAKKVISGEQSAEDSLPLRMGQNQLASPFHCLSDVTNRLCVHRYETFSDLGQLTWTQALGLKNCCVDVWARVGAQALGPCESGGSQSSGCNWRLNVYTAVHSPAAQAS
ncbi:Latent-transforming growth factor beta-binding protein 1 [Chelonia mydas]|uniref:Latent-transforming growth factor beta-binding protein 1 n=1 Tax=Chelonia mydas TaxID=8469 RepID=M7AXF7_CHEMY|nr:Latent-transforming growth factor beta-binding protein 1 [Chelonia mydas]